MFLHFEFSPGKYSFIFALLVCAAPKGVCVFFFFGAVLVLIRVWQFLPGEKTGMDFRGLVLQRVWKMTCFGLK